MHQILHALAERNVLVCVGPLVSETVGLAGPGRLAQRILESLHPLLPDRAVMTALVAAGEFSLALERAERLLGTARFVELARPLLDCGDTRIPLVARAVAALSPVLTRICTTNLDTLLERALATWTALDSEPPDLGGRQRCLVKLCGTAARASSWVLTREQLHTRGSELPRTASWLRSHRLLFIGYRADDEVLHRLLLRLRGRDAAGDPPVNLAFVPEGSITPERRLLLREHSVELVSVAGDYDVGAAEQLHALVDAFERATRTRIADHPGRQRYDRHQFPGPGGPYPGLVPFSSRDCARFFGRTDDVQRAIEQLRARPESRWLIVHGADGIGVSSFVAAGLYSAIVRGAAWTQHGEPTWQGLRGRVDHRPLLALAEGLAALAPRTDQARRIQADEWDEPGDQKPGWADDRSRVAATLHKEFVASARALTDRLASSYQHGLVLVIDGIEEAIASDDAREREQFAAILAHALAHATAPFLLITPIRSRNLGELHRLPQLHERMNGRQPPVLYALAPIGEDGLRQVIREPGERAALMVSERLVERILADVGRVTRGPSPPPPGLVLAQLAAALAGAYRHKQHDELCVIAYEAAGGLTGAVEKFAEQAIAATLAKYGERLVRRLFLTVIAGCVDRRGRPLTYAETIKQLIAVVPTTSPRQKRTLAEDVLRQTSTAGLIVIAERSVRLIHDVLLSHWPRLRAWQAPEWQPGAQPDEQGVRGGEDQEVVQAEAVETSRTIDGKGREEAEAKRMIRSSELHERIADELPSLFAFAFLACASRSDAFKFVAAALAAVVEDPDIVLSAPQPADALLQQLVLVVEEQLGRRAERRLDVLNTLHERIEWIPDHPPVTGALATILLAELKRTCLTTVLLHAPPSVRIAFILVDLFGYPTQTAAALLRTKEPAVIVRLKRARVRIGAFLEHRCEHLDPQNLCSCTILLPHALDIGFITPPTVPQAAAHDPRPVKDIGTLYRSLPGAALEEAERQRLLTLLASTPPPGGSRLHR